MKDDSITLPEATDPSPSDWLIGRYVAGDCTISESSAIERWAIANPDWRDALTTMRVDGQMERHGRYDAIDTNVASQKLLKRISMDTNDAMHSSLRPRPSTNGPATTIVGAMSIAPGGSRDSRTNRRSWMIPKPAVYGAIAAAFSLCVVAIATLTTFGLPTLGSKNVAGVSTHTTGNGQRTTITLPDGSTVLLSVASRLEVPADYDRGNRTLRLEGEALFTVVHSQGRPFTVIAGPSTTRVLGTSFAVRHYPGDTAAVVAVRDGKVVVQSQVVIQAEQVTIGAQGAGAVRPTSPTQFSFASGVLTFNGMLLPDAIPQLNRWYDADIRLGDSSLETQNIVGGFKSGSLTDLAAILEMMYSVRVVRDGRVLTLYPGKQ